MYASVIEDKFTTKDLHVISSLIFFSYFFLSPANLGLWG